MTSTVPGTRRPGVLLDRDGVLNEPVVVGGRPHPPRSIDALTVSSETVEACRRLKRAGVPLVVVTNQPNIARGTCDARTVDAINAALLRRLDLDGVLVCPHDDADECACRKPRVGLLLEAAERWRLRLEASVLVGDRWRDIEAGRVAGCATVLIDRHYDERPAVGTDLVVSRLSEAVPWILDHLSEERR